MHVFMTSSVLTMPMFKFSMGPIAAVHSFHSRPGTHMNVPSNGLLHAELQILPLYCHKHEGNHVVTELVGGHFNEISTSALFVHFWSTEINTVHVN